MLKIIKILALSFFVLGILFVLFPNKVYAQCQGDCICVSNGGEVSGSCECGGGDTCDKGSPSCTLWGQCGNACTSNSQCGGGCCNNGKCGSCGGGGQGPVCQNKNVDCAPGSTIDLNQPISTRCKSIDQSDNMCEPVGSAQRQSGCCQYGQGECKNPQYTTYNCCPAGTTSTPTTTIGENYTDAKSCFSQPYNGCRDADDIFVSRTDQPHIDANRCYKACDNPDKEGPGCAGTWIYNVNITCTPVTTTYSCVATCNTTAPTGLSYSTPNLNWTIGSGGTTQKLYVGQNRSEVEAGCPGNASPACAINQSLTASLNSYPVDSYLSGGNTYWAMITNSSGATCNSNSASLSFTPPPPILDAWWATIDSDVISLGSLDVQIPTGSFLNYIGTGGYPGVAAFATTTNLNNTNVSEAGWLVNSVSKPFTAYSYQYFINKIPDSIIFNEVSDTVDGSFFESGGVTDAKGYIWYKYDGSVTGLPLNITSDMNLGSRRVILLVDANNLNLAGKINLTDGEGFFLVIVNGNINVDQGLSSGGATPALEGLYFAGSTIKTGPGDTQLRVRGSITGAAGITLERDLGAGNDTTPAEIFEYAPDQILLFPTVLSDRNLKWKEVAP